MKIEIINDNENTLFNRREIKSTIEANIAPSREEVTKEFAKQFSVDTKVIKIKGIYGSFGSKKFSVNVNIYKTEEEKNAIEVKKKKDIEAANNLKVTSKAEPEAPKEEVKEEAAETTKEVVEAPVEEPKEEVKEEAPVVEAPKEEVKEEAPVVEEPKEEKVEEKSE